MNSHLHGNQDSLNRYFSSVSRTRMLTPQEEAQTAHKFRETGDRGLSDKLVSANLRFVIKIALEYRNYGFPVLDLIQEGNVGLVRAVQSFDPDKGFRLISYAVWWIRAFIQEYILRHWSLVKIGTTQLQRRLFNHMQSSQKRLKLLVGTSSDEERKEVLAQAVGGTVRDVEEMERRMYGRDLSIDLPAGEGTSGAPGLHDRLASSADNAEDLFFVEEGKRRKSTELRKALASLDEREKFIVEARHLGEENVTLRELGEHLGISKERVRQLEVRALHSLRSTIESTCDVAELLAC